VERGDPPLTFRVHSPHVFLPLAAWKMTWVDVYSFKEGDNGNLTGENHNFKKIMSR
jgi:hypothetical protein